jgi:hypothetical protein
MTPNSGDGVNYTRAEGGEDGGRTHAQECTVVCADFRERRPGCKPGMCVRARGAAPSPAPSDAVLDLVEKLDGCAPSPAEQYHEAILTILGELMQADPAVDSPEGRLLVKLADAVEAYEKVMYPMPPVPEGCTAPDCDCEPGIECAARGVAAGVPGG